MSSIESSYARILGIITPRNAIVKPAVTRLIECAGETVAAMYAG